MSNKKIVHKNILELLHSNYKIDNGSLYFFNERDSEPHNLAITFAKEVQDENIRIRFYNVNGSNDVIGFYEIFPNFTMN